MKPARLPAALLALAPLALTACSHPAGNDSAAALDAVHKVEEAQITAFNADDLEGGLAAYTRDSAFIAPGTPWLVGRDAIRGAFKDMLADPAAMLRLTPKGGFVAKSGDLAVTTADYDFTHTDAATGKPMTDHGVNQTVWVKQDDGSWKNLSDVNVSILQPSGPVKTASAQ